MVEFKNTTKTRRQKKVNWTNLYMIDSIDAEQVINKAEQQIGIVWLQNKRHQFKETRKYEIYENESRKYSNARKGYITFWRTLVKKWKKVMEMTSNKRRNKLKSTKHPEWDQIGIEMMKYLEEFGKEKLTRNI